MKSKIAEIINLTRPEIKFDSCQDMRLFGVLDSLDIILIVEELENQFDIKIEADQIIPENFSSLNTLEDLVKRQSK